MDISDFFCFFLDFPFSFLFCGGGVATFFCFLFLLECNLASLPFGFGDLLEDLLSLGVPPRELEDFLSLGEGV